MIETPKRLLKGLDCYIRVTLSFYPDGSRTARYMRKGSMLDEERAIAWESYDLNRMDLPSDPHWFTVTDRAE